MKTLSKHITESFVNEAKIKDGKYFAIDSDWDQTYNGKKGLFVIIKGNRIYTDDNKEIENTASGCIEDNDFVVGKDLIKVDESVEVNESKETDEQWLKKMKELVNELQPRYRDGATDKNLKSWIKEFRKVNPDLSYKEVDLQDFWEWLDH